MKSLPHHQHEFDDEAFLGEFDLNRQPLAPVRQCVECRDLEGAKVALVQYFKTRTRPHWIFDLRNGSSGSVPHLWPPQFTADPKPSVADAERICRNELVLGAGLTLTFGKRLDWVNEDTRSLLVPGNAFKCCHFMRSLAAAWAATGEARYANKFAELQDRWHQDWPFVLEAGFTGRAMIFSLHYGEKSMPTGQRLFNWITCLYTGIAFAPEVPIETAFQFIKSIWYAGAAYQHFEHSPYEANNHHIMRTCNVPATLALAFPETPRFRGLLELARTNMVRHLESSFLADGGYVERSSSYAQVTLNMFLAPLTLARLNRVKLLERQHLRVLQRAGEQMVLTIFPNGSLPQVGDGIASHRGATLGLLWLLKTATGSSRAETVLERLKLNRDLPPALQPIANQQQDSQPVSLPKAVRYPVTGMGFIRSGWSPHDSALSFNIPNGENTATGHAHDDAFAVELQVQGRPFLGQPAGELYVNVNAPQWRETEYRGYPYSLLSKNVVLPEGRPRHAPEALIHSWGVLAPTVTSSLTEEKGTTVLSGSHRGYEGIELSRSLPSATDGQFRTGSPIPPGEPAGSSTCSFGISITG